MSDESVKQFWEHIKDDNLINAFDRNKSWDDLGDDAKNGVYYIYHMAIGVMAENRR